MIYRYQVKFNKETLKVYLLMIVCFVVGIGGFWVLPILPAIVVCIIAFYTVYLMYKALAKALAARISTYTDGFSVRMPDSTRMKFEWDDLTYAGFVTEGKQKGYLFMYAEEEDKFLQLPPAFENLEGLRAEIEEHIPVEDCVMEPEETIKNRLQAMFPKKEEEEESDETEESDEIDDIDGNEESDEDEETSEDAENSADGTEAPVTRTTPEA